MQEFNSGECDGDVTEQQRDAGEHDPRGTEAPDQVAGKERGQEHAEHVPLDDKGRLANSMVVRLHGERRRGHGEVHHAVSRRPP